MLDTAQSISRTVPDTTQSISALCRTQQSQSPHCAGHSTVNIRTVPGTSQSISHTVPDTAQSISALCRTQHSQSLHCVGQSTLNISHCAGHSTVNLSHCAGHSPVNLRTDPDTAQSIPALSRTQLSQSLALCRTQQRKSPHCTHIAHTQKIPFLG